MLNLKLICEQPEEIKKALKKKQVDPVQIDNIIVLDREKCHLAQEIEKLYEQRNRVSKKMPNLKGVEKETRLKEMQYVKEQLAELEPKLKKLEIDETMLLAVLPNPPLPAVPEGNTEEDNEVLKTVGKAPNFPFEPIDHEKLGKKLNLFDMESAAESSGSRFYYLKNDAVRWEFALVQFVLKKLMARGFIPVIPPVLVKEKAMFGTGFFPADRNEIYHVNPENDDLYLVGTGEVPLCMLYADKIIPQEELPKRFIGFSTCFRREAGTYGKDTHGIFRVHQFDKLEMFSFCHPEKSQEEHEFLLSLEEEILQELGFHYRIVNICGGDLGSPAAKKYDIEVWIPSQKRFRELTSCSNCTDFQARRCNIKYRKQATGNMQHRRTELVHTLNGTAVAMSRMILAMMENFQKKDGTIEIPNCLKPFLF